MYLVLSLGDNDFGSELESTLSHFVYKTDFSNQEIINVFIANCLIRGANWISDAEEYSRSIQKYLNKNLTVTKQRDKPIGDHDGGSAAMDMHTGYIWRF
jgi:hypothetical protein